MILQVTALKRYFNFNGVALNDPGPEFTVDDVRDTYAVVYPDISTAVVETTTDADSITYKFVRSVGTKG